MGIPVGWPVGPKDGSSVWALGDDEGPLVGLAVGWLVGPTEGSSVRALGINEGAIVGLFVGLLAGVLVGDDVATVGSSEGLVVGFSVGAPEGLIVPKVGRDDRLPEGSSVVSEGTFVGSRLVDGIIGALTGDPTEGTEDASLGVLVGALLGIAVG